MKGIIVVDMPENCFRCNLKKRPSGMSFPENMVCAINGESIYKYKPNNVNGMKPDWCPIKPIPKRKTGRSLPEYDTDIHYEIGWNSCIDAIIGER